MHPIPQIKLEAKEDEFEIATKVNASFLVFGHFSIEELHVDFVLRYREMCLVSGVVLFGDGDGLCF